MNDFIDSSSTGTVLEMQSKAHRQWVIDNRLYLHRVIDAVLYLSRQGLPLRGDDESEDSQNCGNFLELIDLIKSIDPNFRMQDARMPDNGKYTSAEIQNELLNTVGCMPQDFLQNCVVVPWREQDIAVINPEYCPI